MAYAASRNPPLAGRPPFATDDNEEIYSTPAPQRRVRQQPGPDPNNRTSAYNMYDQYLDDAKRQSGAGALGMGFMNGDMDSDDEDDELDHGHNKHSALAAATHPQAQSAIPLASPRPGYAAPIAALNLSSRPSPETSPRQPPAALQIQMPQGQRQLQLPMPSPRQPQMAQLPSALLPSVLRSGPSTPTGPMSFPLGPPVRPFASSPAPSVPSTPHPLEAPITPITPAFLRPAKSPALRDKVKFESEPIMRGNSEDNLIPKRGEKGDDFWRRFSMVANVDAQQKGRESSWLIKTQTGTNNLSRWVWFIGMGLLLCIGAGIGLGWYFTHNDPPNQAPKALGGSADEGAASYTSTATAAGSSSSSSPHVSPTLTLGNRAAYPDSYPTGSPLHLVHPDSGSFHVAAPNRHSRHANRTH